MRKNVGVIYKPLGVKGNFHHLPHLKRPIFAPPLIMRGLYLILVSFRLGLTFSPIRKPIIAYGSNESDFSNSKDLMKIYLLQFQDPRVFPHSRITWITNPSDMRDLLSDAIITYDASYVLSMFLHNTSLNITQNLFCLYRSNSK